MRVEDSDMLRPTLASRALGALPDLGLALCYVGTWADPTRFGYAFIKALLLLILLEFLVLHSSMLAATFVWGTKRRGPRPAAAWGLAALYALLAAAVCWVEGALWPLLGFLWLLLGKFGPVAFGGKESDPRQRHVGYWALGMATYVSGAALTAVLPIPPWGIDAAARAGADFVGSGLWVEQPQVPLAFGSFYFAVLALGKTFWDGHWPIPRARPPRPRLP